jgi:hypothetical protein
VLEFFAIIAESVVWKWKLNCFLAWNPRSWHFLHMQEYSDLSRVVGAGNLKILSVTGWWGDFVKFEML